MDRFGAMRRLLQFIFTSCFALCCFLLASFVSWQLLAKIDFAYPQAYAFIKIGENIDYYGPQNRYRRGFELTNKQERYRVFAAINDAVHNHGQGLTDIYYQNKEGLVLGKLLHQAEVIHLQDVANLIDTLMLVGLGALSAFTLLVGLIKFKNLTIPSLSKQLLNLVILLFLSVSIVLLIGAEKVFYQLHIWVFPDNHQWYFFYQDSLMSTLMKAPDLFAIIAVEIILLSCVLYTILVCLVNRFCAKHV